MFVCKITVLLLNYANLPESSLPNVHLWYNLELLLLPSFFFLQKDTIDVNITYAIRCAKVFARGKRHRYKVEYYLSFARIFFFSLSRALFASSLVINRRRVHLCVLCILGCPLFTNVFIYYGTPPGSLKIIKKKRFLMKLAYKHAV